MLRTLISICVIFISIVINILKMVKMKICYLANAQSIHTQKWIKFFADKGHEIHLISFEKGHIENVKVHNLKQPFAPRFRSLPRARIIKRLIERINPEILHAHYLFGYGFYGALCGFKPFIVTAWGSDVLFLPSEGLIKQFIKRYMLKYVIGKADLITCDAKYVKEAMIWLGAASEKISLICFGVDTRRFSPGEKSEKLRVELGIYNSPVVISLRNLEPIYDVESLIKSVPLVLKEIPESKFLIAGKGSEEKRLMELAKSLGVSGNVKFIGFIQNEQIPQYLNTVDIYVSTSLSDAGIAASTAEAMACGLPVIVTDVADNKNWVEDGLNGFVVPVKDPKSLAEKIIYLLKNEDIRKEFGKINRKIIEERNNYYKEMEKMEDVYKELIRET